MDDCAGVAVFLAASISFHVTGVTINAGGGNWASCGWPRHGEGGWRLRP